ncbi:MAG: hypothetical protein NZ551_08840 [Microscillaceae bacterium]|nr:hypothetical protein [Microscillaceae bacterium]MDW8461306.1 hypothetical protein [Cytophagales bacterium]
MKKFIVLLLLWVLIGCKKDEPKPNNNNDRPDEIGQIVAFREAQFATDLEIYQNRYAIVAHKTRGISIFDISKPKEPTLVKNFAAGDARQIFVDGNRLYVAGYDQGYFIFDLSNISNPTQIHSSNNFFPSAITTNANYYFLGGGDGGPNGVIQIRNKTDNSLVATIINSTNAESQRGFRSLCVSGNFLYGGTNGGHLKIYNISNPNSPQLVSTYYNPGTPGHAPWMLGIKIYGNIAYLSNWGAGFIALDVSNPSSPVERGIIASELGTDKANCYDAVVLGNTAYIANGWGGLSVVDVSNVANMKYKFEVNESNHTYHAVEVVGDYAYVVDNGLNQGLRVIKVK